MKALKIYDIDISKLNLEQYDFSYQIDDTFFELFDYSLIDHGNLKVDVLLDKKLSFMSLAFKISGSIQLTCDRSLETYDYNLNAENEIVLKYGDEALDLSDEIEIIPHNTQRINIANYMYEFISVAIPMKKLHPRYKDEPAEDQIIYSSDIDETEQSDIDPRWSELKKLKNKE